MASCPVTGTGDRETKKVTYLVPFKGLETEEDFNNIHTWFADKRKNNPVYYNPEQQSWSIFSFEDVNSIIVDHKRFSLKGNYDAKTPFRSLLDMDPPEHTRIRRVVGRAFTPKVVKDLEPIIVNMVNDQLKIILENNEVDLVNDYAYPITIQMLTKLLGVPLKDQDLFKEWAESTIAAPEGGSEEDYKKTTNKITVMLEKVDVYLLDIISTRREEPKNDLISQLIAAEIEGEYLTDQEILEVSALLLQAGFGTTARLISNAIRCIIETPGLQKKLREDPSQIPLAIEEIIRLYSSIYRTTRYAKEDVVVQDKTIKAGEELNLWIASANRDEKQFNQPNKFDINRGRNHHIGFGKGVHFCLGSALARLEVKVAIELLLANTKHLEFKEETFKPIKSQIANGLEELWIKIEK